MMNSNTYSTYSFTSVGGNFEKFSELEKFFEIQRTENEAARVVQKAWRRTRILLPWRRAVLCQKMAQRIQKRIRGVLTRKWVAEWFHTRNSIVITWQAHSRRFVSNKHIVPQLAHEKAMATRIQKIVRGRLARVKSIKVLNNLAATRIQTLWRGVVGRLFTDKLWLQTTVIPVQCMYRRRLAQKRFGAIRDEFNNAAVRIQKKFRNWYSRARLGDALFQREMGYRMSNIRMLTSEEELCQENLTKSMERLVKNGFKEKAEAATKELIELELEIYSKENDLTEFRRQSEILSSRAREQGFDVELAKNIKETREQLTELKFKHIFELSVNVHRADEMLEDQVREVESWAANRNRVAEWRTDQYDERRHLNYKRELLQRRKAKRIAIAEEKRRWQVYYYTADGKPDKKRRPGRPWDASIYAGGEKAVYSGGSGVNLMAHIQKERLSRAGGGEFKLGSIKSVDQTLQQVSLQTYLEEINLYEQLLKPITKIMEKAMGTDPSGLSNLALIGFGEEGAKMVPALQDIGAIPPPATQSGRKASGAASAALSSKKRVTIVEDGSRCSSSLPSSSQEAKRVVDLYNNSQKVNGEAAVSSFSKQSSFNSACSENTDSGVESYSTMQSETPYQVLQAAKQRKKLSRKSLLPALDAFTNMFPANASNKDEGDSFIGDLKTLDRLFEKQATAAILQGGKTINQGTDFRGVRGGGTELTQGGKLGNSVKSMADGSYSNIQRRGSQKQLQPIGISGGGATVTSSGGSIRRTSSFAVSKGSQQQLLQQQVATPTDKNDNNDNEDTYWNDITKAAREEEEARRLEVVEKRRARKRAMVRSSTIPWELLDQIDGQKHRWENEKLYHDFNHKY